MSGEWFIYGLVWLAPWALITAYITALSFYAAGFREVAFSWPQSPGSRVMQAVFWAYLASGWLVLLLMWGSSWK